MCWNLLKNHKVSRASKTAKLHIFYSLFIKTVTYGVSLLFFSTFFGAEELFFIFSVHIFFDHLNFALLSKWGIHITKNVGTI